MLSNGTVSNVKFIVIPPQDHHHSDWLFDRSRRRRRLIHLSGMIYGGADGYGADGRHLIHHLVIYEFFYDPSTYVSSTYVCSL